jgi:pimeloyl-ACP methyl ester carboxylesterase
MLGVLSTIEEPMGWGTSAADVARYLPDTAEVVVVDVTGHFLHIERPNEVAEIVLDFLR